jgi:hypothetical protein
MNKTPQRLYKDSLDKAFSEVPINIGTMSDRNKYKAEVDENNSTPMIKRSIKKFLHLKKEENLKGGVSDNKTLEDIAKKHDKKGYYHIDNMLSSLKKQLNKGIKVEMEHTKDKSKAREIAMDHLWEHPNYYDRLEKIESKEGSNVSAKKQFAQDLKTDKDYNEFKKRAKYKDSTNQEYSFGTPNVSIEDFFINKKKHSRVDKIENKEATGSGSVGAYSAPLFGGEMDEKWSQEYKKTIDCNNPKGFSQKAHCQSKSKKKETKEGKDEPFGFDDVVPSLRRQLNKGTMFDTKSDNNDSYRKTMFDNKFKVKSPKKKENKEATGSGSSGAYVGPVFGGNDEFWERSRSETPKLKESDVEKVEATEATGSGSVGGYESPAMWAKSTKKKDWGPSRKTQIPGGGFVKIKKKCTKFPYCNQGDINNIKISKNESVKEAIKNVASKMGVSESVIKTILEYEYEKINKRTK